MAVDIDEAIQEAALDIAIVAYGAAPPTLATQFQAWIDGMYDEATGIFTDRELANQRTVIDWLYFHLLAQTQIEGPAVGDAGVVGTSAVIDVVVRVLWAVKVAEEQGWITTQQRDDVVALYQNTWD